MGRRSQALLHSALVLGVTGLVCAEGRLLAQAAAVFPPPTHLVERASERLRVLQEEADRLAGEATTVLQQLRRLELERQIAAQNVRDAQAAIDASSADAERLAAETGQLTATIDEERPKLRRRLIDLYKMGRGRYTRLLLSAADVRQFGRATRTVAAMNTRDRQRIEAYEARSKRLADARSELETTLQTLETRRRAAAKAQADSGRAVAAQAALIREIDQRRDLNAALVSELQTAHDKLEATLAGAGAVVGAPALPGLPIGPFRGALPWPAAGLPERRATPAIAGARPGIEIRGSEAAEVVAVHDGVIAYAGSFEGFGNLVIVDHGGGTFSLYGHLLEVAVGRGVPVQAGRMIGRIGGSRSGAPTLYFELRVNGKAVDPLPWLHPRPNLP